MCAPRTGRQLQGQRKGQNRAPVAMSGMGEYEPKYCTQQEAAPRQQGRSWLTLASAALRTRKARILNSMSHKPLLFLTCAVQGGVLCWMLEGGDKVISVHVRNRHR